MNRAPHSAVVGLKNSRSHGGMPSSAPTRPDPIRERYETLLEISESIASRRTLPSLFEDLSRSLKRLVAFDFIGLTLLDEKSGTLRLHLLQTDREVIGKPREFADLDETPTGVALETGHP